MQITNPTFNRLSDNVLVNDILDKGLMALMSSMELNPDTFYLTGYETITFNRTRQFALETVLNSVVPFEKELLVLTDGENKTLIQDLCDRHDILSSQIQFPKSIEEWEALDAKLTNSRKYSHVLFICENNDLAGLSKLIELGGHMEKTKIGLIVHCKCQPVDLSDVRAAGVDFMICNGLGCSVSSVVLARRSKLVQAEGISRSYTHDLYGFWQKTLLRRKPAIEPMEF